MGLTVNWLPKHPDKVIKMGKEKEEEAPPPAVPIADVDKDKPLKEAATTPPVVETVHKEKRSRKPKEGQ